MKPLAKLFLNTKIQNTPENRERLDRIAKRCEKVRNILADSEKQIANLKIQ